MRIGAAAYGIWTAAFANKEDAFLLAVMSMALTASACTMMISLLVKKLVLKVDFEITLT